jgi:hypothetical protein
MSLRIRSSRKTLAVAVILKCQDGGEGGWYNRVRRVPRAEARRRARSARCGKGYISARYERMREA